MLKLSNMINIQSINYNNITTNKNNNEIFEEQLEKELEKE